MTRLFENVNHLDLHYPPGTEKRARIDADEEFLEANKLHWAKHSKKRPIELCLRAECINATQEFESRA